jgi:peptidoglycan/LPS O-acetylase OafA/YrhL
VVTHSPGAAVFGISLMSGITAVQCFYVISGFLITMILNERPEYKSLRNFYLSRYLRLWPVYILIAALTLLFFQRTMFPMLSGLANWPAYLFIALSNLTIFFPRLACFPQIWGWQSCFHASIRNSDRTTALFVFARAAGMDAGR